MVTNYEWLISKVARFEECALNAKSPQIKQLWATYAVQFMAKAMSMSVEEAEKPSLKV